MISFDPAQHRLEFTHIPKCGGNSLHHWLRQALNKNYVVNPQGKVSNAWGSGGHQMRGQNPINDTNLEVLSVAVLRDRLDRFLSLYRYVRSRPDHYLHARGDVVSMSAVEFADFCKIEVSQVFSNLQSQYILGSADSDLSYNRVIDALEAYWLIGVTDRLDEFVGVLSDLLPGAIKNSDRQNITSPSCIADDEMEKLMEKVYSANRMDIVAHNHAQKLFTRVVNRVQSA